MWRQIRNYALSATAWLGVPAAVALLIGVGFAVGQRIVEQGVVSVDYSLLGIVFAIFLGVMVVGLAIRVACRFIVLVFWSYLNGAPITRKRPDPRLVPDQAVYDHDGLLIIGRTRSGGLLIHDISYRRTELPHDAVQAVILKDYASARDQLHFRLKDDAVEWRAVEFADNGSKRRDEVARFLGLA